MPRGKTKENAEKRFKKYTHALPTLPEGSDSPCWGWSGGHDGAGYPMFWYQGQSMRAYRAAWLIFNKIEPVGELRRACQNPHCCNPRHCRDELEK